MAYLGVADFKSYRGIDRPDDDVLITSLIAAAQEAIDTYTGRTFEADADTTRTFDAECDVDGRTLWLDEDLAAVTSITNGDGTTVTSAQYTTKPRNHTPYYAIELKHSASVAWVWEDDPADAISVTGKWAYSAEPPADIVQAARVLVNYWYTQKDAGSFEVTAVPGAGVVQVPQGFPSAVKHLLDRYVKRM